MGKYLWHINLIEMDNIATFNVYIYMHSRTVKNRQHRIICLLTLSGLLVYLTCPPPGTT